MRSITYREALREAIREEMATDERVFILGEDVGKPFGGANKVTQDLWKEFGEKRVRNTPISENTFVGAALGAALLGMRPIVEIMYFDFITLAIDQIVNQIAKKVDRFRKDKELTKLFQELNEKTKKINL